MLATSISILCILKLEEFYEKHVPRSCLPSDFGIFSMLRRSRRVFRWSKCNVRADFYGNFRYFRFHLNSSNFFCLRFHSFKFFEKFSIKKIVTTMEDDLSCFLVRCRCCLEDTKGDTYVKINHIVEERFFEFTEMNVRLGNVFSF
jgi:hypothetical protein